MMKRLVPFGRALLAHFSTVLLILAMALPVANYMRAPGPNTPWYAWGMAYAYELMFVVVAIALNRWVDRRPLADFRLRFDPTARMVALWGSILTVILFALFVGLTQVAGLAVWHWSAAFDLKSAVLWAILYILVGPGEEFLNRGYVLNTLSPYGEPAAVIISSILFALIHTLGGRTSPLELLSLFLCGYVYALLTLRSRSIWPAVILHSVYDPLSALVWANMANISALSFTGNLETIKFVYKSLMAVPYLLLIWSVYGKREMRRSVGKIGA